MKRKKLFWLMAAGVFSMIFLTLLTISFYRHVLKEIGVDAAESISVYDRHYVMIVSNTESKLWNDVYQSIKKESAKAKAYVEIKGKNLSSGYTMTDFMEMSIAAQVDGIWLEYTGEPGLKDQIDRAISLGIPVVTVLNDAPTTKRSSYVGINAYQLGQEYGREILNLIPPDRESVKVTVLLRNRTSDSSQSQILNQINNVIITSPEISPQVKIEEIQIASGKAFESEEIVWKLFQNEEGPPDLIVCLDEVDTETVYQSLIDYNRVGKTRMIGYYISDTAIDAVGKGIMSKTLYIDADELGRHGVQAMTECLQDGRTNSFYTVGPQFISEDTVFEYTER